MPRKILLADDSVTAQNMGRRILTEAGYEVITVNNGAAAMKKIAEIKPDLVVLDVHMPGYGGLEICQRMREMPKLSRIPVLLTVGKLEPFRPDDARRVKADAFVIKPFEASELLAVLTRLEDKIVPAMPDSDEEGSGWRSRLRIPAPYMKRDEAVHPADDAAQKTESDNTEKQAERTKTEKVVAIDAPGPREPEKTAEIEPAAGALSEQQVAQDEPKLSSRVAVDEDATTEIPTASFASSPEPETEVAAISPEPPKPDEVAAAVASIAPSDATQAGQPADQTVDEPSEMAAVMANVTEPQSAGPRWVASEVAVSDEESTLVLELEMQRAYAAFAAADAARWAFQDPRHGNYAAEPPAQSSETEQKETEQKETEPTASAHTAYDPEVAAQVAAYIDNEDDLIYSEIAAAKLSATAPQDSPSSDQQAAAAETPTEEKAAYAVAAAGASSAQSVEPVQEVSAAPPPAAEPASQEQTELANAWDHWKQVRESVVSPEFTSQIAESAAEIVHESQAAPAFEPEDSSDTAGEASEIANIVDSVLADLKPRLMEEISKKMGKNKKK